MRELRPINVHPDLIEAPCSDAAKWTYVALCCGPINPEDRSIDSVVTSVARLRRLPIDHIMAHFMELVDAGVIYRHGDVCMLPDMPAPDDLRTIKLAL